MRTHRYELPIRVLLSRDGRDYVAHGLEVDLLGYGRTEDSAMSELHDALAAQMAFASQTNRPEMVYHPAPKEYFERWEAANEAAVVGCISEERRTKLETKATFVTFSEEEIRAAKEPLPPRKTGTEVAETA